MTNINKIDRPLMLSVIGLIQFSQPLNYKLPQNINNNNYIYIFF
nr:MAG TPA: hypothetical protein [Caudoviricetes sp.]